MPDTFALDDLSILADNVSPEMVDILTKAGENVKDVLGKPITVTPKLDTSHPISSYFVSTSHNTYLTAHQLYGDSSTSAYSYVLSRGGRCVEIDAWDGPDGHSVVYHGYTLTSKIPIRDVCEAINAELKPDDLPVIVALECHADLKQQETMVKTFEDVFGDRLIKEKIEGDKDGRITLEEARGRVLIKVEHCSISDTILGEEMAEHPKELHSSDAALDYEDHDGDHNEYDLEKALKSKDEDEPHVMRGKGGDDDKEYEELQNRKKNAPKPKIWRGLARLGIYTTSIKPKPGGAFLTPAATEKVPPNQVINISESGLHSLLPAKEDSLVKHNAQYLMRVYPAGSRISSGNLDPIPCWHAGAQLVALNWQTTDRGTQCNEALFSGTSGWVLKPPALLSDNPAIALSGRQRLTITVEAASGLPRPEDCKSSERLKPYVKVQLLHAEQDIKKQSKTIVPPKRAEGGGGENPVWGETFEFEYAKKSGVTFLRMLLYHDDGMWSADDFIASTCLRVEYLQEGHRFIRLRDQKSQDTNALLLVKVKVEDA